MSENPALARARERALKAGRERPVRNNRTDDGNTANPNPNSTEARLEEERRAYRARKAAQQSSNTGNDVNTDEATMDGEDRLILKGRQLQNENREALANSIRVASEAAKIGAETNQKLDAQTEQMLKMDENLDATNASITRSDRLIRGMKSIGGAIANVFSKPKAHKSDLIDLNAAQQKASDNQKKQQETQKNSSNSNGSSAHSPQHIDRSVGNKLNNGKYDSYDDAKSPSNKNNQSAKASAALSEFEKNRAVEDDQLDQLGGILDILNQQASESNKKLNQQGVILDHLDPKITNTTERIKNSNREMKKIT